MRKNASRPLLLAALAATFVSPAALADDDTKMRTAHIIDTTTDRTPAKTAFPRYPRIARRDRIEGEATVCFKIDTRGRIRRPRVRESTHPIFKRPVLRAIRASSFEALAPNEVLATSRTCRTYRFRLEPVVAVNGANEE